VSRQADTKTARTDSLAAPSAAAGPGWSYSHRGYALRRSLQQLTHSRAGSLLTLLMLGVTLALPAIILFLLADAGQIPLDTEKGQSLTLYLNPALPDLEGAELAADIARRAAVKSTDYISRAEALATFSEHAEVGDALAVLESNPLPGAIVVYPNLDGQGQDAAQRLATDLKKLPAVELVQQDLVWVERLAAVLALARQLMMVLGTMLAATALIVIGNTVRLEMLRQRREMEVTRLLGAKRRFVLRPFLYLGTLYGLLGASTAVLLAMLLHSLLRAPVQRLADAYGSGFRLSVPQIGNIMPFLISITLLALLVAWITALWRFRKLQPETFQ